MIDRLRSRLDDILDAIDQIDLLLRERTFETLLNDRQARAAYERFLEIISEASRHIPADWKQSEPEAPWRKIADIGNHLRHAYFNLDPTVLWDIHQKGELVRFRAVIVKLLKRTPSR